MAISRYVSPAEALQMMEHTRNAKNPRSVRNEALLQFLYGTGVTLSELARVTVGDIFNGQGDVNECFVIKPIESDSVTKTVYLFGREMRRSLMEYRRWRKMHFARESDLVNGTNLAAVLFVDDQGSPYDYALRSTSKNGRSYYSFRDLTTLIRQLHADAGVKYGNAESARRSWSVWMASGVDGRPAMHLDWLRTLRGDKRLSTTVSAIAKDMPQGFDLHGRSPLNQFMRLRAIARPEI